MCFLRSILHGRMTFCHVADSPKFGAQQQRLLGQRSHLGEKYMWEVSDVQTLPKVLGAWWFLGIAWWKTSSHVLFCFQRKLFLLQHKMAPEECSEAPIAWRMNIHPMWYYTLQTTELQPSQQVSIPALQANRKYGLMHKDILAGERLRSPERPIDQRHRR